MGVVLYQAKACITPPPPPLHVTAFPPALARRLECWGGGISGAAAQGLGHRRHHCARLCLLVSYSLCRVCYCLRILRNNSIYLLLYLFL